MALATSEKGGRALVGGDDEIGDRPRRGWRRPRGWTTRALDEIVRDREQRADEDAVAFRALRIPGGAIRGGGKLLGIEAALGAGRHDDGVLHHLRLQQAQGSRCGNRRAGRTSAGRRARSRPPRRWMPSTRGRIDPDLGATAAAWAGRGRGAESSLKANASLPASVESVGAQRRPPPRAQTAQDAVVIDRGDLLEAGVERGHRRLRCRCRRPFADGAAPRTARSGRA